jgi:hypothetical protein
MNRIRLVFSIACAAATVALAPSSQAAGLDNYLADHVAVHGDVLDAYNRQGRMLWHYRSVGPLQVNTRSDGNYEINGRELVGRDGRLIERLSDHAPAGVQFRQPRMPFVTVDDTAAYTFSPVTEILNNPDVLYDTPYFLAPVFDSAGNAWTAVYDVANDATQVMESDGVTGTWTIRGTLPDYFILDGAIAVDGQGNVTVGCLLGTDDSATVQVARFQPTTGWSTVNTLYTAPSGDLSDPFQKIYISYDAAGDAIVTVDATEYGAAYFVYSNANQSWGGLQQMPLATAQHVYEDYLSRSLNGKYLQ